MSGEKLTTELARQNVADRVADNLSELGSWADALVSELVARLGRVMRDPEPQEEVKVGEPEMPAYFAELQRGIEGLHHTLSRVEDLLGRIEL